MSSEVQATSTHAFAKPAQPKFPGKPKQSDFLRARLQGGEKRYFDSGDYNVAKGRGKPAPPKMLPTAALMANRKTSTSRLSSLVDGGGHADEAAVNIEVPSTEEERETMFSGTDNGINDESNGKDDEKDDDDEDMMPCEAQPETAEAFAKPAQPKFPCKPKQSEFLRARLQGGDTKYFDSGDYNMAKGRGTAAKAPVTKKLPMAAHLASRKTSTSRLSSLADNGGQADEAAVHNVALVVEEEQPMSIDAADHNNDANDRKEDVNGDDSMACEVPPVIEVAFTKPVQPKFPGKPKQSDFLRARLQGGEKRYFDSGDYNVAKGRGKPAPTKTLPTAALMANRKTSSSRLSCLAADDGHADKVAVQMVEEQPMSTDNDALNDGKDSGPEEKEVSNDDRSMSCDEPHASADDEFTKPAQPKFPCKPRQSEFLRARLQGGDTKYFDSGDYNMGKGRGNATAAVHKKLPMAAHLVNRKTSTSRLSSLVDGGGHADEAAVNIEVPSTEEERKTMFSGADDGMQ